MNKWCTCCRWGDNSRRW